jgi:hypothetical protein
MVAVAAAIVFASVTVVEEAGFGLFAAEVFVEDGLSPFSHPNARRAASTSDAPLRCVRFMIGSMVRL